MFSQQNSINNEQMRKFINDTKNNTYCRTLKEMKVQLFGHVLSHFTGYDLSIH